MIKSMTGYGKTTADIPGKKICIEMKSLNSKQMDITLKLPWLYKEKESEIRNIISTRLNRGKIDLSITCDSLSSEETPQINKEVIIAYFKQLHSLAKELHIHNKKWILPAVMKMPDTLKNAKDELSEEEWHTVKKKLDECITRLDNYRIEEGKTIERDFATCIDKINTCLEEIKVFEPERINRIREKLNNSLEENLNVNDIDRNRFEQEIIYYIEKLDINEEKSRLKRHCDYFMETLSLSEPNGRTLNFIAQEMGREINTMGSKANDASIQKIVVKMKDELEKIKEQTLNAL